ncbi:MAG: methyltransferase domain-containing protein [Chlamydiales bacterium]|nr:methyltransferase domain-containing protein [Chlamydiales bacterium]
MKFILSVFILPLNLLFCLGYSDPLYNKAELYNKNSVMQTSLAENVLIQDLVLSGNEEVLDVGCGDGKLTYKIAKKLIKGRVTAIDKSEFMIEFAKKNHGMANINYLQMDVHEIDKLDKQFDTIVVFSSFHWFEQPKEVLKKMTDKLKKGGKIYILTYPAESQDWAYYKEAFLAKDQWKPMFEEVLFDSFFSSKMFDIEAEKLGLHVAKNQVSDQFQNYSKIDDFKNCVKGWLSWFAPKLPSSDYDEYTDVLVEKGKSQFVYDEQGNIRIPYKSIIVILEK